MGCVRLQQYRSRYVPPVISERNTEPIPCNCTILSLPKSFHIIEIGYVAATTSHVILGRYCLLFALTNSSNGPVG